MQSAFLKMLYVDGRALHTIRIFLLIAVQEQDLKEGSFRITFLLATVVNKELPDNSICKTIKVLLNESQIRTRSLDSGNVDSLYCHLA